MSVLFIILAVISVVLIAVSVSMYSRWNKANIEINELRKDVGVENTRASQDRGVSSSGKHTTPSTSTIVDDSASDGLTGLYAATILSGQHSSPLPYEPGYDNVDQWNNDTNDSGSVDTTTTDVPSYDNGVTHSDSDSSSSYDSGSSYDSPSSSYDSGSSSSYDTPSSSYDSGSSSSYDSGSSSSYDTPSSSYDSGSSSSYDSGSSSSYDSGSF